jgi:hypothetical protein
VRLNRSGFKEFLELSRLDRIMEGNPYNVQKEHLYQLRKKIKSLGFLDSYREIEKVDTCLMEKIEKPSPYGYIN